MLFNTDKIIYSLFDRTGNWSKPYSDNGYEVIKLDLSNSIDIRFIPIPKVQVYGVLASPPCTAFSKAGAHSWPVKDKNGATREALELIGATARFVLGDRRSITPTGFAQAFFEANQ